MCKTPWLRSLLFRWQSTLISKVKFNSKSQNLQFHHYRKYTSTTYNHQRVVSTCSRGWNWWLNNDLSPIRRWPSYWLVYASLGFNESIEVLGVNKGVHLPPFSVFSPCDALIRQSIWTWVPLMACSHTEVWTKWPTFCRRHFQMRSLWWRIWSFDSHFIEVCFYGSNWWIINISWALLRILTHWGRVTHVYVGKLTNIGSDNGLSPGRRQDIIWTNAGILLIWPLGTNFSETIIDIHTF